MRFLINYFREVFCAHVWEREECKTATWLYQVGLGQPQTNIDVSATCTKCGYHKSYTKF